MSTPAKCATCGKDLPGVLASTFPVNCAACIAKVLETRPSHTTRIVTGLWAGPWRSLSELGKLQQVEVVVSCLPIGTRACDRSAEEIRGKLAHIERWEPGRKILHRILVTSDTDRSIPPEHIRHALDQTHLPTLIHCNAGQNRSTMLAACWLLLHRRPIGGEAGTAAEALAFVSRARAAKLGKVPNVYPEMRATVERFADWLGA
jgi:hypothetical protein